MKKLFAFLFICVCALTFVACGEEKEAAKTNETNKTQEGEKTPVVNTGNNGEKTPEPVSTVDAVVGDEFSGLCTGKKVYATTCGQADLATLDVLLEDSLETELELYTSDEKLVASEVEDGSVVFLVVGGSNKGLGAAGTDVTAEANRASDFASAAKSGKITLVVFHIGGESRRGDTSDPIIKAAAPSANLLLVVESGNSDGYFTSVSEEYNIPLYLFSKAAKLKPSLAKLFA